MDINDIRSQLEAFAEERGWRGYHSPRNLMLALVGEIGELSELLQWRDDADVDAWAATTTGHQALSDELADVFIYLVQLAAALGVDLEAAVPIKIGINAHKHRASSAGRLDEDDAAGCDIT